MKKATTAILAVILFVTAGCGGGKQSTTDFITVDVTKNYPKKDLILQDFMDVEYVPLETNDDFLCQGFVLAVGEDILIVRNYSNDGDIFIFDKRGKAIKKFNKKGQGGEEYLFGLSIVLDENNEELFVNDLKRIIVYDLNGTYKRSFKHKDGAMFNKIYNFDKHNFICKDDLTTNGGDQNRQTFMLMAKQDGSITKEISIPFKEKIITNVIRKDEKTDMTWGAGPPTYYPIIKNWREDNWILVEPSSDTLFSYSPDHVMTPFVVRTPSVQSMNPEVFLFLSILTDRYYFMSTAEKVYDFEAQSGFPTTNLVYDRQGKSVFEYTVYNGDFSYKKPVYMAAIPLNGEIVSWNTLNPAQLIEDYEGGKLKGRLKEIAATLDEESNPVLMLIKHKK